MYTPGRKLALRPSRAGTQPAARHYPIPPVLVGCLAQSLPPQMAAAALRPGGFAQLGVAGCAAGCATCFGPDDKQQSGSRPPRRHPCWVCAVKEEDNVPEPSPWQLVLNALEDSTWPRTLASAARSVGWDLPRRRGCPSGTGRGWGCPG